MTDRLSARKRGYDKAWDKLRMAHLAIWPWCRICGDIGVQVDHIESVKDNPRRRLDPSNLQTLCDHHHSLITQAFDAVQRGRDGRPLPTGQADARGMHLDASHPWFEGDGQAPMTRGERKIASIIGNRGRSRGNRGPK